MLVPSASCSHQAGGLPPRRPGLSWRPQSRWQPGALPLCPGARPGRVRDPEVGSARVLAAVLVWCLVTLTPVRLSDVSSPLLVSAELRG